MKEILLTLALALGLSLAACEAPSDAAPKPVPPMVQPTGWKAVLVAGDDREPAFDNAVDAMAGKLEGFGVPHSSISILKATARDDRGASLANIRRAFAALHPGPTDGCFVFVTSHGGEGHGLYLARDDGFLSPVELASLLAGSCGARPTAVVASGCYAGSFAEGRAMPAPNRAILTAARDDRPSFGCDAGLRYTVFDQCLLDNLERGITWTEVMGRTKQCVSAREHSMGEGSSYPQLSVGSAAAGLKVFTP